ncbi:cytochrome P450 [Bathymodiolus japonicus methanotrophic gill symbiont]|uniref:cytochrome P450 n=1 Tax=Bathymodiolus japonicus methanotrophic gill symbiont TaxID=113269 RepID=UPI001E3BE965|nr:cytochrome P450 [Bathymodiolus japonicus methanotrophic gill symbiont]
MPGALPLIGNMLKFGKNPYEYMNMLRSKLGEIGEFRLFHQQMILLTGPEGNEAFFRAPDAQLDQNEAYKVMTPIFGKGVVFDAPPHIKDQQLKMLMPGLRDKPMRTYSKIIVQEVEEAIKGWGETGEIDLLDFMKQLTIYTSSHCLLGNEFRYELNEEFSQLYHDLEKGMHPIAFIFPYLPIPILRRRDKARIRLQELVTGIIEKRARKTEKSDDAFQMLIDTRYDDGTPLSPHEITGLLIGTLFAGHHTTAGTAAWITLELARNPKEMERVLEEFDQLYGHDGEVTFQSLREIPIFERVIKEVLRLHPPLIMLIRKVAKDLHFKDYVIKTGKYVCVSPRVSHRIAEIFPDPEKFDPDRFTKERQEDAQPFSWVAFGGGRHKCSGNAFAMLQLKAIYAILLRRYNFELVESPESYQDDYTEMVAQPGSPCMVRYTKRTNIQQDKAATINENSAANTESKPNCFKVEVDYDLCQGHANCMAEAPEIFQVDDKGLLTVLQEAPDNTLLKKAQAAAKYCPTSAIKINQD